MYHIKRPADRSPPWCGVCQEQPLYPLREGFPARQLFGPYFHGFSPTWQRRIFFQGYKKALTEVVPPFNLLVICISPQRIHPHPASLISNHYVCSTRGACHHNCMPRPLPLGFATLQYHVFGGCHHHTFELLLPLLSSIPPHPLPPTHHQSHRNHILVCVVIDTTLLSMASPVTSIERTMFAIPKAFVTDSYPIPLYGQLCGGWGGLGGLCQEKHIPLSGMDLNLSDCCGGKKICSKIQDSYTMLVIKVLSHNPCNASSLYPPSESDWTYL